MTTTWPGPRRIIWTAILLAGIAGLYLYLRNGKPGSAVPVVLAILLVIIVLLGNFLALGIRVVGRRRSITLPWYLLRRVIDVGLIATVVVGFIATTGSPVQHSESIGSLPFNGDQLQVTGTVGLPVGDVAIWYAVHCDSCGEIVNDRSNPVRYPKHVQVTASGPGAVTVLPVLHGRYALTDDHFGVREEKQIGLVHVAAAGIYTVHVLVDSAVYPDRRVFLGTPQPALLDPDRLRIVAVLLALSALISLRPRRRATDSGPRRRTGRSSAAGVAR